MPHAITGQNNDL